jgi:hypothetical protein
MLRFPTACLCALALASCTSYEFRRQDLAFRHDSATDVLELIVVDHGLLSTGSTSGKQVAENSAGARHVILLGWPFEFDLAELEDDLRDAADDGKPFAARALAWLPGVDVDEAALWRNAEGELSLYRRISIARASEGLALLSEVINAHCAKAESWHAVARDWDAASGALWQEHVMAGRSWASFADGGLVVRVPVSAAGAARALGQAMRQSDDGLLPLAEALTSLAVADGVATLAFLPDDSGWVRLHPVRPVPDDAKVLAWPEGAELRPAPSAVLAMLAAPRKAQADGK